MVTKNTIKYIRSLSVKKYRDAEKCFVVEGPKAVSDLLPYLTCRTLFATPSFQERMAELPASVHVKHVETVTPAELERLSQLRTPRDCVAVFEQPERNETIGELAALPAAELCLALDGIQDPGNLGTILRIADWFGIRHVFASHETADVFAPKVVQATMGAIGTVKVHYVSLPVLLRQMASDVPVYGTFLDGQNIYEERLDAHQGLIVMGNEGQGISDEVASLVTHRLLIPSFAENHASESLNVAVATSVVCSEIRRQGLSR